MNCFKKIAKYLNMESIQVILDFLMQSTQEKTVFEDFEDEEMNKGENFDFSDDEKSENEKQEKKQMEDNPKSNKATPNGKSTPASKKGNSSKKANGSSKKMFDDLVDVEMA